MVSRRLILLTCCALLLPLAACSSTVRRPRLLHPGPAGYQQANAEEFDPYPQNDMGPEIVGGRPPDYRTPPNEVTRARQQQPVGPWRSAVSVPAPVAAPVTPPVIGAPVPTPVKPPIAYPSPTPVPMTRY